MSGITSGRQSGFYGNEMITYNDENDGGYGTERKFKRSISIFQGSGIPEFMKILVQILVKIFKTW